MGRRVLLCVDGQSLRNPAMVGLAGEPLDCFSWLECATSAEGCREAARRLDEIEEVWVVSCDDMEPLNVAAAVKHDDPKKRVFVVSCGQSGSLASRAARATIDGLRSESQFLKRFAQLKKAHLTPMLASLPAEVAASVSGNAQGQHSTKPSPAVPVASPFVTGQPEAAPSVSAQAAAISPQASVSAPTAASPQVAALSAAQTAALVPVSQQVSASAAPAVSATLAPPIAPARPTSSRAVGKRATVIAVASGTGGSGKSTLSAVMALACSRTGLATIAVDADLQFGDLHHLLGVSEPLRIEEVTEEPSRLERLISSAGKGSLSLLAAPRRLETSEEVARELPRILDEVAAGCDVAVVNTGSFWSDTQAMVFDAADAVAFVTDSRPSSLRGTTHAVELCARIGVATTSFVFVVNRHDKTSLLSAVDVSCSLRGAHAVELPHGGRDVDELLGSGYAHELFEAKNPLVMAVHDLLVRLLPEEKQGAFARQAQSRSKRRVLFGKDKRGAQAQVLVGGGRRS